MINSTTSANIQTFLTQAKQNPDINMHEILYNHSAMSNLMNPDIDSFEQGRQGRQGTIFYALSSDNSRAIISLLVNQQNKFLSLTNNCIIENNPYNGAIKFPHWAEGSKSNIAYIITNPCNIGFNQISSDDLKFLRLLESRCTTTVNLPQYVNNNRQVGLYIQFDRDLNLQKILIDGDDPKEIT